MERPPVDVLVADGGVGSLAVAYLLAERGRTVALVDPADDRGDGVVSAAGARRVEPLADVVLRAPRVDRWRATLLTPEGGLTVELASRRLLDAADESVLVPRRMLGISLLGAARRLGVEVIAGPCRPLIGASGAVEGVRTGVGSERRARWTVLPDVDVRGVTDVPRTGPMPPTSWLEAEWHVGRAPEVVRLAPWGSDQTATVTWLYGDPFDGVPGYGRLVEVEDRASLTVVVPIREVQSRGLSVSDLADRLRAHPTLEGRLGRDAAPSVHGRTIPAPGEDAPPAVGDGWVAAPAPRPDDPSPLTTGLAMAEATVDALDAALDRPRASAAAVANLPAALAGLADGAGRLLGGPIDAWADELVRAPGGLVGGLQLLAERFAAAG